MNLRNLSLRVATDAPPVEGPRVVWRSSRETTRGTQEALGACDVKSYQAAVVTSEKLIGDNNLRAIGFLEMGLRLSKAVCLVEVSGFGSGTGFIVAPGLVLTNNHVLPTLDLAKRARMRFNYEEDLNGRLKPSQYFLGDATSFFVTNATLDYSVVAVRGFPELQYGVIPISPVVVPSLGARVNIIQHPSAGPKQIAMVDNEVEYVDDMIAQYLTDTLPGSSGAPVFDDDWHLVALHHSGGWLASPSDNSTHFRNEGILRGAILKDLASRGLARGV